ncbi:MAG: 30S ribosomal protein S16, partial [Gammaproteobacteria bacterium]|nr:30S ribosomal protein S16 [Gammaproteobacteria bacterium]
LDLERLDYWVSQGAKMSDRVNSLSRVYRKKDKDQDQGSENGEAA